MMKLQKQNSSITRHSYHLFQHRNTCFYIFKVICITIWIVCVTDDALTQKQVQNEIQDEEISNSYIETFLGDQQTPLVLLKREILSSGDVLSCSTSQEVHSQNMIKQELKQIPHQQVSIDYTEGLLLGIPLTALNKLMNIMGIIIDFSDRNQAVYQTPPYQDMFRRYHLANTVKNVQAKLINSNDDSCFLGFFICHHQDNCITDDEGQPVYYTKFPVLGISQNHKVVIIDPTSIGDYLKDKIIGIKSQYGNIITKIEYPRSFIIGFSQSTLVFDIVSTLDLPDLPSSPEMTTRWSIKFGLDKNKENFVRRTPTEGVEYLTTYSSLQDTNLILLRDISRDNPAHFYIKNVPNEYQEPFQQAFDYWNTIFISLRGYPAFTYKFIQGNYDGEEEIIVGDVRYNILEWDLKYRHGYNGDSMNFFDLNTGEIWSTIIQIQGPRLVEEYSKWFRYSDIIRSNEVVRESPITAPFYKSTYNLISQVSIDGFPLHQQPLMLAPENETFDSYIPGLLRTIAVHEIGHSFGLDHEFRSSTFAQNSYVGHSVMDYLKFHNANKPVSGTHDTTTLAYGYLDRPPEKTDISCSDSDLINYYRYNNDNSPECSQTDETNFPLENFALRLRQTLDLLTSRKDDQSFPYLIWNNLVANYVGGLAFGLISYYFSAETHYDQLQTVLIEGRKPETPQEVKDLVMEYLESIICGPEFNNIIRTNGLDLNNTFDYRLHQNAISFLGVVQGTVFNTTDIRTMECP